MCVASFSAFKYGHNARPDMLYAFWTTAVLAVWLALREVSPRQARYGAWAMWLLFALATLTKGPQAPAIMLGGAVVYDGLFGAGWRLVWRRLHAVVGVAIVAVIVLPWYLWLRAAIGATTLTTLFHNRMIIGQKASHCHDNGTILTLQKSFDLVLIGALYRCKSQMVCHSAAKLFQIFI